MIEDYLSNRVIHLRHGVNKTEAPRKKYIQSEVSRIMTSEGTVIKNMVDGSIEVCAYY